MFHINAFFFFLLLSTDIPLRGFFLSPLHLLCPLQSCLFSVSLYISSKTFFPIFASFRECCYISVLLLFYLFYDFLLAPFLPIPKLNSCNLTCSPSEIFLALFALPFLVVLPHRPSSFLCVLSNVPCL